MTGFTIPARERGAALLAILLLVTIMGAIAAASFEKSRLSTALAQNSAGLDQARAFAIGVETLLALRIDDLVAKSPERTTLAGDWNGKFRPISLPGEGFAQGAIRDGGNCFNINSVADGDPASGLIRRSTGIEQFVGLMKLLAIPERTARLIASASADWVDTDREPGPYGAEDATYAGIERSYLAGNSLFAEVSELRAVAAMTPDIYTRLRPYLCALPSTELSPLNVNTLLPDQAPLLAMLAPDTLSLDVARAAIASRPAEGWRRVGDFWQIGPLANIAVSLDAQSQVQLNTHWFALDLRLRAGSAEFQETALIDARFMPSRVAVRRWGKDD